MKPPPADLPASSLLLWSGDQVKVLRVEFFGRKDLLSDIEDQLPLSRPLSSVVRRVNLRADLGLDLAELVKLTGWVGRKALPAHTTADGSSSLISCIAGLWPRVRRRWGSRGSVEIWLVRGATTSRQYVDYGRRAWGPQEEELGEKEMNPFLFNRKVSRQQAHRQAGGGSPA